MFRFVFVWFVGVGLFLVTPPSSATETDDLVIEIQRDLFPHHRIPTSIEIEPSEAATADANDPGAGRDNATLDEIRNRPVRAYFVEDFKQGVGGNLYLESKESLIKDLKKLNTETARSLAKAEEKDGEKPVDFAQFEAKVLRPAVESFTFGKLVRKPLLGAVPLADWSVDDLLKNLEAKHVKQQTGRVSRVLRFLDVRRLTRAQARNTVILVGLGGLTYYFQDSMGFWVTLYLLVVQEPARELSGALTGFLRRPFSQNVKILEYRWFGNYEAKLGTAFSQFLAKLPPSKDESVNSHMLPASIEVHGMNFAGASAADQIAEYEKTQEGLIHLQKVHNQLNTEAQQWGRRLELDIWEGESYAAHFLTVARQRRENAANKQDRILEPYVMEIMTRSELKLEERLSLKDRLMSHLRQMREAHDAIWKDPYLPEEIVRAHIEKIHRAERGLIEHHVSYVDRHRINEQEKIRHETTARAVMGIALNDRRLYLNPEENRNLPPGRPRLAAAEVRKGYGLQNEVDEWQVVVATILRRIGQEKNSWLDAHIERSRNPGVCVAFPKAKAAAGE